MAIEFDAVVLCNILNSQLSAQLTLDKHGLASWEYIKNCILNDDYITDPFQISHNYAKSSIIAYHVGKLIAKFNLPEADKIKEKLKVDLFEMLSEKSGPTIDNLLISSTLHRLNLDHEFEIEWPIDKRKTEKYSFFIAGLLSSYENTFLQSIAILPIFHIQWNCPAHTLALITENLLLKNHKKT